MTGEEKCHSQANDVLLDEKGIDTFVHEQNLLIHGRPPVLIMGCGHKGVVNIMEKAARWNPKVCIGGFHLMSLPQERQFQKKSLTGSQKNWKNMIPDSTPATAPGRKPTNTCPGKMEIRYLHCGESLEI